MTSSNNSLSRTECSAMRGIAILCIALHNFCHFLAPAVKENEYTFSQHNVLRLLFQFDRPDWSIPVHLLSFFGHYGVPVFLFLSAYGLVKKYECTELPGNSTLPCSPAGPGMPIISFLRKHYVKLFIMMIPGYVAFIIIDCITANTHGYHIIDIIAQLGLFNNLLPQPDKVIWPGPYWFFGLMMQLYIVYRLVMYRRHWGYTVALMVACYLMQCFLPPESDVLNYFRYNFVGSILPFGLGILYARYLDGRARNHRIVYLLVCIISLVLIYYGSLWYQTWFWVPVAVCIFSISLVKITPSLVNNSLKWVGGISSAIFVCHPITRKLFLHISKQGDIYTGILIYLSATILLGVLFSILNKWINRKIS